MNQLLFEQFVAADGGKVLCKQLFNSLKNTLLKEEGIPCGYEVIVVREFCHKCGGKGAKFIKKLGKKGCMETCPACKGSGFYKNENRYYRRYALHGMIFKLRIDKKPEGEPVAIHQGYPREEATDITIAYRAMLILFAFYNDQLLTRLLTYAFPAQEIWAKEKDQILALIEKQKAA